MLANTGPAGPVLALDADLGEAEGRNKVIHAVASRIGSLDVVVQSTEIDPNAPIDLARASSPLLQPEFRPALVVLVATDMTADPVETIRTEWSGLDIQVVQVHPDHARPSIAAHELARILSTLRQGHPDPPLIPEGRLRRLARQLMSLPPAKAAPPLPHRSTSIPSLRIDCPNPTSPLE